MTLWEMKEADKRREYVATWDQIDTHNKGWVTVEEVRKFLLSVGEAMSDKDFEKFLKDSELVNADNLVTRGAFLSLFK